MRESGRGRLGRREGKGALATKSRQLKSRHLSLTCHVGTYNISRVNEALSKQTFMEHFSNTGCLNTSIKTDRCEGKRILFTLSSYLETKQMWSQ